MVVLKIRFGDDIRRITRETISFEELQELLQTFYPHLGEAPFSLKWKDDEEDLITVASEMELREAVNFGGIVRLFIFQGNPSKRDEATATVPEVEVSNLNAPPRFDWSEMAVHSTRNFAPRGRTVATDLRNCSWAWNRPFHHRKKMANTLPGSFDWMPSHDIAPQAQNPSWDLEPSQITRLGLPEEKKETIAISRGWSNPQGWNTTWRQNSLSTNRPNFLARFVSDVSIADGTCMGFGEKFVKTWRIRNEGQTNWPLGAQLTVVGGDPLGAKECIDVPAIAPGEEVDVSVEMTSPDRPGRYVGYWRMAHDGLRFGQRLWVDIIVAQKEHSPSEAEPVQAWTNNDLAWNEQQPAEEKERVSEQRAPEALAVPQEEAPQKQDGELLLVPLELEEICRQLSDMGFTNRARNLQLLREHSNSLVDVLTILLQ